MKKTLLVLIPLMLLLIQGCAISIPLREPVLPLVEKEVQGEGKYKILIIDISGTVTSDNISILTWEIVEETNIGLNASMLDERLNVEMDYFII